MVGSCVSFLLKRLGQPWPPNVDQQMGDNSNRQEPVGCLHDNVMGQPFLIGEQGSPFVGNQITNASIRHMHSPPFKNPYRDTVSIPMLNQPHDQSVLIFDRSVHTRFTNSVKRY